MISQGNSDNQTGIAPERGLECVRSVDSGQSVEVIPDWVVLLADDLTISMQEGQFREPVEGTITETLKQMQINRKIVHRLIKEGGGEIHSVSVYMEPYRQNRIIQERNGKT